MGFVGVIDSGVGGLTVLRQLRASNKYRYVYLADHAFCPYGTKNNKVIIERTVHLVRYLKRNGAEAVVLACNTMSTHAAIIRAETHVPIYEVITPTCQKVLSLRPCVSKVALLATKSTVKNGAYTKILNKYGIEVVDFDCSDFVNYVERGEICCQSCRDAVYNRLKTLPSQNVDAVILGCTHFPLMRSVIQNFCNSAHIVESCCVVPQGLHCLCDKNTTHFVTTGDVCLANRAACNFGNVRFVSVTI